MVAVSGPNLIVRFAPEAESTCTGVPTRSVLVPNRSEITVGFVTLAKTRCGAAGVAGTVAGTLIESLAGGTAGGGVVSKRDTFAGNAGDGEVFATIVASERVGGAAVAGAGEIGLGTGGTTVVTGVTGVDCASVGGGAGDVVVSLRKPGTDAVVGTGFDEDSVTAVGLAAPAFFAAGLVWA